jgi:hypothetical protein
MDKEEFNQMVKPLLKVRDERGYEYIGVETVRMLINKRDEDWLKQIMEFKKSGLEHPLLSTEAKAAIDTVMQDFELQLQFHKLIPKPIEQ